MNVKGQIKQDATYSAETHHRMATRYRRASMWLQVIPAIIAAVTSWPRRFQSESELFALADRYHCCKMSAVARIWNPQKSYQENLAAAKGFTILKHDARFLCEAQSTSMTRRLNSACTNIYHYKYNDLVKNVPET